MATCEFFLSPGDIIIPYPVVEAKCVHLTPWWDVSEEAYIILHKSDGEHKGKVGLSHFILIVPKNSWKFT